MTPLDAALAEIEARANAATEGPWRCRLYNPDDGGDFDSYGDKEAKYDRAEFVHILAKRPLDKDEIERDDGMAEIAWIPTNSYGGNEINDFRFFASARTDVPRLVAALRVALDELNGNGDSESAPFALMHIEAILTGKEAG